MQCYFITNNSFEVLEDKTSEFLPQRRIKVIYENDSVAYATVISSVFIDSTVVVVNEPIITITIKEVFYSVIKPGAEGNLAPHFHSTAEGDGGCITYTFNNLIDAPTTYSGSEGCYAQSTGSGIVWSVISQALLGLSDTPDSYENYKFLKSTVSGTVWSSMSFIDLVDTPVTYSGSTGYIAMSTGSGIAWAVPAMDNNFHGLLTINDSVPVVTDELLTYDVSAESYNKITISGLKESLYLPKYSYDLIDMPKTYSEGFYLKSTVSGTEWAEVVTGGQSLIDLLDTPDIYEDGKYLKSTTSGTVWSLVETGAGASSFLDLTDTPDVYGNGNYLRTTYSGVTSVSGIILTAPDNSEWLVRVTNTGVLYTTAL